MSRFLAAAIGVVAFLLAACASAPMRAPTRVSAETIAALDAANAAFSAAWVAGDVDAIMAAYTEDAVVHPPAGGVLTAPEHVRTVWASLPNTPRAGHRLEPTLRQLLRGGEVLEMGRWHSMRVDDWQTGCYTAIWRKDDGRWRMQYDAWSGVNDHSWACRPRDSLPAQQ